MKLMPLAVVVGMVYGSSALAAFHFEKHDGQVCRVESGKPDKCLPLSSASQSPNAVQVGDIDFTAQLKARRDYLAAHGGPDLSLTEAKAQGSAIFMNKQQVDGILAQYSILSLRDFATGNTPEFEKGGYSYFPYFASVRWANGKLPVLNGTVYYEGYVRIAKDGSQQSSSSATSKNETEALISASSRVEVKDYQDSPTELNGKYTYLIEKAARYGHFTINSGFIGSAAFEQATVDLAKNVVAPMVYAEAFVKASEKVAPGVSDGLAKEYEEVFRRLNIPSK